MTQTMLRRLGICGLLTLALSPLVLSLFAQGATKGDGTRSVPATLSAQGPGPFKTQEFNGKVVPLATVLKKAGVELDADAGPHWLGLVTADGTIYALVKDAGTRMFFQDPVLLNRPMRLTGRLVPKTNLLQVVNVHSYRQGKLHEVYYWCDICTIRGYEKTKCGCCGAPMELREVPVK